MRAKPLPFKPSRSVLMTGMPPATAASKFNAAPWRSARLASFWPCRANSALLAVTTDLPDASAASTAAFAGSPAPPITSTRTSIDGSRASATGSATQRYFFRSMPRFLPRARAVIATTSIGRPHRATSLSRPSSRSRTTDVPTVPSPARPTFSGSAIKACQKENGRRGDARLTARGERNDVVQHFRAGFKKAPDVAGGLADALLVLDQRDAHKTLAVFAEAGAGRHRDARLLDQKRRELDAAERLERFRNRRPGEHRGARRRNSPAGAAERFDERIAAPPIGRAHFGDAVVRAVERRRGRDLDRREGTALEIGFQPRQGGDDALVADRKTDAPPRHRISLRHRGEFDRDVHGAGHLQHRRGRIVVEIDFGIREVRKHQQAVPFRERDEVAIKVEIGHARGRVRRIADHDRDRLRDRM